MRPWTPALLAACICAACCWAPLVEGRRNLRFVAEEDDDEETFNFDLQRINFTLKSNSIEKFCFNHEVSCVRYEVRARDVDTGEPATILALVTPFSEAERAQEEGVISTEAMLEGTYCRASGPCRASARTSDADGLCLLLVNANLRFEPSGNLDFTPAQQGDIHLDIDIDGCPTTSQRIVAIAVPIAVFVGVAACFSTWWIRRRRKDHMTAGPPPARLPNSGSTQVAMMTTYSANPHVDSGLPPPPTVTPANPQSMGSYGPQAVYAPQPGYGSQQPYGGHGVYGPQAPYAEGANPAYIASGIRQVNSKGYPVVVANV
ncbi:unnamed protein product [Ostreobium quekettii]|uniref:Uncharacterized protein n=1 Tax=Ostreobium quekettii TaxID=121088 RepID=A0A8S1JAX5_9CHLO|nr:unnamed protein product [Ostreobium quekettii]|eukprot:evm.model.scf_2314.3 EVM.evm.TU.scf_2314.3   scf_2314:21387-24662(+)